MDNGCEEVNKYKNLHCRPDYVSNDRRASAIANISLSATRMKKQQLINISESLKSSDEEWKKDRMGK